MGFDNSDEPLPEQEVDESTPVAADCVGSVSLANPATCSDAKLALHRAAWESDMDRLQQLLRKHPSLSELTAVDPHGNTALHLASLQGNCETAKLLVDAGAQVSQLNSLGWSSLHDAAQAGHKELAHYLALMSQAQLKAKAKLQRIAFLDKLAQLPDFTMQLKWELNSSVPGLGLMVRRYAPHDTYTIYKQGSNLRVDGTLMGVKEDGMTSGGGLLPEWERGYYSLVCTCKDGSSKSMFINHTRKTWTDLKAVHKRMGPEQESALHSKVDSMLLTTSLNNQVLHGHKTKSRDFKFEPVKGWLGKTMIEDMDGWRCKVYDASFSLVKIKRFRLPFPLPTTATWEQYLAATIPPDPTLHVPTHPLISAVYSAGKQEIKEAVDAFQETVQKEARRILAKRGPVYPAAVDAAACGVSDVHTTDIATATNSAPEMQLCDVPNLKKPQQSPSCCVSHDEPNSELARDKGMNGVTLGGKAASNLVDCDTVKPTPSVHCSSNSTCIDSIAAKDYDGRLPVVVSSEEDRPSTSAAEATGVLLCAASIGSTSAEARITSQDSSMCVAATATASRCTATVKTASETCACGVSKEAAPRASGIGCEAFSNNTTQPYRASVPHSGASSVGPLPHAQQQSVEEATEAGAHGSLKSEPRAVDDDDAVCASTTAAVGSDGGGGGGVQTLEEQREGSMEDLQSTPTFKPAKRLMGRCWMAEDFPLSLHELLPLLEAIGTANKYVAKVAKFMSAFGDRGEFPVKVLVPLLFTLNMHVTFKKFKFLPSNASSTEEPAAAAGTADVDHDSAAEALASPTVKPPAISKRTFWSSFLTPSSSSSATAAASLPAASPLPRAWSRWSGSAAAGRSSQTSASASGGKETDVAPARRVGLNVAPALPADFFDLPEDYTLDDIETGSGLGLF